MFCRVSAVWLWRGCLEHVSHFEVHLGPVGHRHQATEWGGRRLQPQSVHARQQPEGLSPQLQRQSGKGQPRHPHPVCVVSQRTKYVLQLTSHFCSVNFNYNSVKININEPLFVEKELDQNKNSSEFCYHPGYLKIE